MSTARRDIVRMATAVGMATLGSIVNAGRASGKALGKERSDAEISAPEDLMREHGVLDRLLLIYEEGLRRLQAHEDIAPEVFGKAAGLVRRFVEDYHERLEENFIFPQFEKRHQREDLVAVLRQQHQAGRQLTDAVARAAAPDQFASDAARRELVAAAEAFIRMYRPHAAREDTVLFPALYTIVTAQQVQELGEQFEQEEHRRFGPHGFEETVEQVAAIEKQLGIYDLAAFTRWPLGQ